MYRITTATSTLTAAGLDRAAFYALNLAFQGHAGTLTGPGGDALRTYAVRPNGTVEEYGPDGSLTRVH